MSKRTIFTTVTPLPLGMSRATVLETLHNHLEMIDLAPSCEERHRIDPPPEATPEEYHCSWYQITDRVLYLPAGIYTRKVSFKACFHDLADGIQTHVYAPMGLDIKEKWTLGGSLPGEPSAPVEIGKGLPQSGLYLREDVEMHCNFLMIKFVKATLKKSLATLVARLVFKSQLAESAATNRRLTYDPIHSSSTPPHPPPSSPPIVQQYPAPINMLHPPQWSAGQAGQLSPQYLPGGAPHPSYTQQVPVGELPDNQKPALYRPVELP